MTETRITTKCRSIAGDDPFRHAKPSVRTRGDDPEIPVRFNGSKYRSFHCHVREKANQTLRRIDRMVNCLFLQYMDTINRIPFICDRIFTDRSGTRRLVIAIDRQDHPSTVSVLEDNFLSLGVKLAILSLNACTLVLEVFAPLVAYFCQDLSPSIEIHEAHIVNVRSDQEVHVLYLPGKQEPFMDNEEPFTDKVAKHHSMFRITATNKDNFSVPGKSAQLNGTGTYCDPTAAQYGRSPGLKDATTYHSQHPDSKTVYYTSLGYYYRVRHLSKLETTSARDDTTREVVLQQEAHTRTMNNTVHRLIEETGGREVLFDMTPTDFEAAITNIVERVRSALLDLAGEFYGLQEHQPQGIGYASLEDRYRVVMDRCMGEGHTEFLRALDDRVPRAYRCDEGSQIRFEQTGARLSRSRQGR